MFDSAPSNLPVEPPRPSVVPPSGLPDVPPSMPPLAPPLPSPSPTMPMATGGRKEPEDIFSGLDQGGSKGSASPSSLPPEPKGRSPIIIIGLVVAILIVLAGIGFAVWSFIGATPPATPVTNTNAAPTPPQQIETPPVTQETPPVTEPPAGTAVPVPTIPPPTPVVVQPTEGKDTDSDVLTDVEEPYYDADALKSDTDGDGYPDGSEVKSLFSPAARGAALSGAPFMTTISWHAWTFLAPKPWSIVPDATDPNSAFLLLGTASRFSLTAFSNANRQSLDLWLVSQSLNAPVIVTLKNGLEARQTSDGLTTYIASGDSVLRVTYDLNGDTTYEYRTSYAMLLNSLTPPKP